MHIIHHLLLCFVYLSCIALPAVAAPLPDERNCTQAIALAQKTLKEMPAKSTRDKEGLQQLTEKQEKLITENRSKGVSECEIWRQVMGNAFNQ